MAGIDLSQNIISASADASVGGILDVGAETSVDFRGSAKLKRGIELELGVGAMAQVEAGFSKFLAADVQGRAEAKAQLKGQIQAPTDLFSEAGMAVRLQAVAQLALTGRLAIGLAMGDFIALANDDPRISGVYLRLLEIFLEELEIQAGVKGRVAYSAMAYLNLVIAGRLVDDAETGLPAGFTIAADCGAGLKGGGGWELFANMGLKNPRRFIRRSVDVLVDEMVREIGDEMPDDASRERLQLIRAPAKMALRAGFELGLALVDNASALSNAGPQLAQKCVQVVLEEAQRILLEQITILAIELIQEGLEQLGAGANAWSNSADEREFLIDQLGDMPDDPFEFSLENIDYWNGVVNAIAGVTIELAGNQIPPSLAQAVALLWSSMQLLFVTTQRVTDASVRASFFGSFTAEQRIEAFKGQVVDQAPAPSFVRAHINAALGRSATADLLQEHLVTFMTGSGIDALIERYPDVRPLLEVVAGADASPDALAAAASTILSNAGAFVPTADGTTMDPEASLRALADGLEAYIDVRIRNEVAPMIYAATGDRPELRLYVDEVLLPSMDFIVETAFDGVIDWSFGNVGYADALKEACSSIVMKVVGRSLVVTTDILMTHASKMVSEQLHLMADAVDDPGGLGDQIAELVDADKELVGEVLQESLDICAEVFGPMPDATRAKIRNLLYMIIDSVPPNPDSEWLDQLQQDLFIPNAKVRDALLELGNELGTALAGYLQDFYERVLTRIGEIALEEIEEFVNQMVAAVEAWVADLNESIGALLDRLADLPGEIADALAAITLAMDAALDQVINFLEAQRDAGAVLTTAFRSTLYTAAHPELLANSVFGGLAGSLANKALASFDNAIDAATESGLLGPVMDVFDVIAIDAPVALLEEIRTTLAELREIDPDANVIDQVQGILIGRAVDQLRDAFDGSDPSIAISFSFSVHIPAIGIPGTWLYKPASTQTFSINLGSVTVSLDQLESDLRTALSGMPAVEEAVRTLAEELVNVFTAQDHHATLVAEQSVSQLQQAEFAEQLSAVQGGPLSATVLDPVPGGVYEHALNLDLHIRNATPACLGLGELEQSRVAVLLNYEALAPERFAWTQIEGEPEFFTMTLLDLATPVAQSGSTDSAVMLARAPEVKRTMNTSDAAVYAKRALRRERAGAAHGHSTIGVREPDAASPPAKKLPLLETSPLPSGIEKEQDILALGRGLRLRLQVPFGELRLGINTLSVAVTDGQGHTDTRVVTFVAAPADVDASRHVTFTGHPDLGFDEVPDDVARWLKLAEKLERAQPRHSPVREPADSKLATGDATLWIDSKRSRRKALARAVRIERNHHQDTATRMRRVRAAIGDGALKPKSRVVPNVKHPIKKAQPKVAVAVRKEVTS